MTIDEYLSELAEAFDLTLSFETPNAENVVQDAFTGVALWRNIIEDGTIKESTYGMMTINRHIQLGFRTFLQLDSKGVTAEETKESLLQTAFKFYGRFSDMINTNADFEITQDCSYTSGYDDGDANMAFVLLDIYVKDLTGNCGL